MTEIDQRLHSALLTFVCEAIPILRKKVDTSKIPKVPRFELVVIDGKAKVKKTDGPCWWQVSSYMRPATELPSFKNAIHACAEHPLLRQRHGMQAYILNHGSPFFLQQLPWEFLAECIAREDGLIFRRKTFDKVFNDLLNFVTPGNKNHAKFVAPIDIYRIMAKQIELPKNAKIKRLSTRQIVELINLCPILMHFYTLTYMSWFNSVIEIDIEFETKWVKVDEDGHAHHINDSRDSAGLVNRLTEELLIMRCLLKKPVHSPTYVYDYRGWNSSISTGGSIHELPGTRANSSIIFESNIGKAESKKYYRLREKFFSIQDQKTKRRIFAAMRRLSAGLGSHYSGDRLMDVVAGLEGLLVNSKAEVTHQFAENVALLLERDPQKRLELFGELRKAYSLRSKIAHGDFIADDLYEIISQERTAQKHIDEFNTVNRLSHKCTELLHQAIIICIENEKTDFNWGKAIMSGKERP